MIVYTHRNVKEQFDHGDEFVELTDLIRYLKSHAASRTALSVIADDLEKRQINKDYKFIF